MTDEENSIGKLNVQLDFNEGSIARRETRFLPDGAYYFEDFLAIGGELPDAVVITCNAWLLEIYELKTGEIFFTRGAEKVCPQTKRFAAFYPPFSIARANFSYVKAFLTGIAATDALPDRFSQTPVLLEIETETAVSSAADVEKILNSAALRSIGANPQASQLARKAKKLIDENYTINLSIGRVAARLEVSPEHLSRQFKRDFGFAPSVYLHQLRTSDAVLRLAKGEEIIDLSQDVGYNDLSRFYKQFRKNTRRTPGNCQLPKRRTASRKGAKEQRTQRD